MVNSKFHTIRTDVVLEAVTLFSAVLQVKAEVILFPHTVEAMQYLKALQTVQFPASAPQPSKSRGKLCSRSLKKASRFLNAIFMYRDGYIFLLKDSVVACCLLLQHFVIFPSKTVKSVISFLDEYALPEVLLTDAAVVYCYLGGGTAVKGIEKCSVVLDGLDAFFVGKHIVIYVGELP